MEMKTLIAEIVKNAQWYEKKHDVEIDVHFAAYNLIKEIGQFADSILIQQGRAKASSRVDAVDAKEKVTQELVDIVALAIINADLYDIDIEAALLEKWMKHKHDDSAGS